MILLPIRRDSTSIQCSPQLQIMCSRLRPDDLTSCTHSIIMLHSGQEANLGALNRAYEHLEWETRLLLHVGVTVHQRTAMLVKVRIMEDKFFITVVSSCGFRDSSSHPPIRMRPTDQPVGERWIATTTCQIYSHDRTYRAKPDHTFSDRVVSVGNGRRRMESCTVPHPKIPPDPAYST